MAVYTLPTPDADKDPYFNYATTLDGRSYVLRFLYNHREDVWYLSIYLPDLTPLQTGVKMVDGVNLIQRADVRLPTGALFVYSKAPANTTSAGLEELGEDKRVVLVYITADEPAE